MKKILLRAALIIPLCCVQMSCTDSNEKSDETKADHSSKVLATVNGDAVSQSDVDFMIERLFSGSNELFNDADLQRKVLDSLVASKAMKLIVDESLTADERAVINNRVQAYEEELYVKEYLTRNAKPEPVTTQMIQDYYQQHLSEFGGVELRTFEYLRFAGKPSEQQRDKFLSQAAQLKSAENWAAYAKTNEFGLVHQRAIMRPGLLDAELEGPLLQLAQGESSDVVFVRNIPHLLRLIEIEESAAQPMSAVSAQIRKKLAAVQLKKAVKRASDEVIGLTEVTYN